ncbi:LysR substrate-binding domain-containing protein [Mesorhizobium sp. M0062]|uniref:LysR substrate-binding domain-containing protein n=1 Tax=Mesorhizobium sp. M0062 TaxID=2956867 RepID=UPI0033395A05
MQALDPDLLKTFLAFVDGGSLAQAASAVGRSPSAVTAQMQRLEEIVGEPLLVAQGRGRGLTPAGEDLVGHARRILAVHSEAWLALKGARAAGRVAIGTTQDFADSGLPELLRAFATSHPRVRVELRVGRSAELGEALQAGQLDLAIVMRKTPANDEVGLFSEPMLWLCSQKRACRAGRGIAAGAARPLLRLSRSSTRGPRCCRPPLPHCRRQRQPCRLAHGGQCRHRADLAHRPLCPFRHCRSTARIRPAAGADSAIRDKTRPGRRAAGARSCHPAQRQPRLARLCRLMSKEKADLYGRL